MKKNRINSALVFLFCVMTFVACTKKQETDPVLTVSPSEVAFEPEGGETTVAIECNEDWVINNSAPTWLQTDKTKGTSGNTALVMTIGENKTGASRTGILSINSTNGQSRRVVVKQSPSLFPSYNTSPIAPDATGMGSTAMELNAQIKLGINIWNTMETPYGETGWGNPVITQNLIDVIKSAGFNAIRIPCQYWVSHANRQTGKIDDVWLNRLKEVVQYCVNDGMYALVNDHHDGFMDCKATGARLDSIKAIQRVIWEQVATKLRDFDEHVMFASSNEPGAETLEEVTNLHDFHQIFINAVRSTGGKNAYRTLVIQAPNTSLDRAAFFSVGANPGLPIDPVPNKLIIEFHYYTPPNFCILTGDASWGKEWRYWGANLKSTTDTEHNSTAYEEEYMESAFQLAKERFVDNGIPLLLGEFGTENHSGNCPTPADSILSLNSRAHFLGHIVRTALANNVSPFLWAGVINRQTETLDNQRDLDSLRVGAGLPLMNGK